jgi:hypothetical protein
LDIGFIFRNVLIAFSKEQVLRKADGFLWQVKCEVLFLANQLTTIIGGILDSLAGEFFFQIINILTFYLLDHQVYF